MVVTGEQFWLQGYPNADADDVVATDPMPVDALVPALARDGDIYWPDGFTQELEDAARPGTYTTPVPRP